MFREKVSQRQLAAWLLVAMSAPLIQLAGKYGWFSGMLVASAGLGLCWLVTSLPTQHLVEKKWYCLIQLLLLIVLTAEFAKWSADSWPTGTDFPIVPLTLLALALFSAMHGASGASRVPSVLFWFLTILYGIVLAAGAKNVKLLWLQPRWDTPGEELLLTLLLPAAAVFLPRERGKAMHIVFPVILLFFSVASVWTVGTISPALAGEAQWPFYESSKSLSLLGTAERFEALVSVAVTLGYFSLYSFLLSAVGCLGERIYPGSSKAFVICSGVAAAALMLLSVRPAQGLLVIITFFAWCALPVFGGFTDLWKKRKKERKNP